jgi:hypothetical protein
MGRALDDGRRRPCHGLPAGPARDLPETRLRPTSRRPTTRPSTAPFTCAFMWGREVLRGIVNSPRIDGMQGVRGSNPLSSTRHNATPSRPLRAVCQQLVSRSRGVSANSRSALTGTYLLSLLRGLSIAGHLSCPTLPIEVQYARNDQSGPTPALLIASNRASSRWVSASLDRIHSARWRSTSSGSPVVGTSA